MKPFKLERAIAGDKIVTRGWQHVKFVAYLPELGDDHQVVCVVDGSLRTYSKSGAHHSREALDLFIAPKTRTVWVNLRLNGSAAYYDTEEEAEDAPSYMARLGNKAHKIEVEE